MIELGGRVRDKVNGFTGIVIGIAYYLYASDSCLVSAEESKDNVSRWIDRARLENANVKHDIGFVQTGSDP